jgi:predicted GNAT family N-acyltransferase
MEACYALRHTVFVAEQNVPIELERDGHDAEATHFVARSKGRIVGTARARGVGRSVKAERVAVLAEARGHGVGRGLMEVIEEWTRARGLDRVTLHAQIDALAFYRALGYREEGEVFEEAGIPHRAMHKDVRTERGVNDPPRAPRPRP